MHFHQQQYISQVFACLRLRKPIFLFHNLASPVALYSSPDAAGYHIVLPASTWNYSIVAASPLYFFEFPAILCHKIFANHTKKAKKIQFLRSLYLFSFYMSICDNFVSFQGISLINITRLPDPHHEFP